MKKFIFKTTATMKEYNARKWWIDSGVVREIQVEADNLKSALQLYREAVKETAYIEISDNAIKNKSAMYVDSKAGEAVQVGYVITGKTDFQKNSGEWSTQYIDLWVTVLTVVNTDFMEVA